MKILATSIVKMLQYNNVRKSYIKRGNWECEIDRKELLRNEETARFFLSHYIFTTIPKTQETFI